MASLDRELRQLIQAKDLTWDQYKNKIKRPQQRGAGSAVAISQSLDEPDEGDEDPDTPARSETRPEDPAEAAYWDAWGIVDIDRFGTRDATGIATAVAEYGKLIRTLSEQMSVEKKKLKQADQAGREADVIRLKDDVALRQLALQKAFEAGEEFGDPQVLANLGGNKKLVSDLVTALIHAYNSSDFTGPFAKSVLRLMAHITTITHELLFVSLRFKPIHKKFLAKGDEEVKALVDEIVANAESRSEAVSKSNNEGGSTDAKSSTPDPTNSLTSQTKMAITSDPKKMAAVEIAKQKSSGAGARVPSDSSPSKRPRDDEPDSRNVKKVAVESATGGAPQPTKVAAPKAVPNGTNQATQPKRWAGTGLLPGKSRPVAKPVSKVGSNKPDSSKPEPPKTPAAASTKREVPKTTSSKPEPPKNRKSESDKSEPPSSGRSVLGALLEEIAKPKKAPPPAPTPDSSSEISETPEEKERRLRKEKRRKLRVTWKEDLTQVRVFHKDDAEDDEINSMVPGARDERSEGLSLKRGHEEGIKLDEDEDDDPPYRPWEAPNPIDFSVIPNEKRQKSFVTRGGVLEFETDQQKFIRERESREIMAYYEHPSQIPPTPRSPRPVPEKEPALPAAQGAYLLSSTPQLQEIHRRWKDVDQSGLMKALRNALERGETSGTRSGAGHVPSKIVDPAAVLTGLGTLASSSQQAALPYSEQRGLPQDVLARQQLTSLSRDDQVLELLRRVKSWKDPEPSQPRTLRRHDYPDVKLQQAADAVEEIAEMLKGRPFPPTEPPEWLKEDATRMAEWWHGYTRDKQREAQRLQEGQSLSTMQVSQPAQPASVQQAATSAQDSNTAAWMAYYAQLSQAQPQQQNPYAQYYATYTAQAKPSQQPTPAQLSADPNSQLQALLATLGSGPQSTQHTSAPSGVTDPQLQALLASMAATPQAAPAMNASNPSDPAYQAYMLALAQYAAGQQQPSNGDSNGASAQTHEQQSRQQKGQTSNPRSGSSSRGDKSSSSSIPPHLRGINREKIGTKPCVFWANGTCNKGDKCTFRHD
ncbi:C-x8-c-x5-c-x3-h type zinc finger protein [Pleurostoma richardsiae]|uniref:C-x8-c-x5-c-x3-h type zinc finger protein n=1 Tax=Pleurostoma richardsiae TaxID=41990 RepID=A0AA38S508_9PEZI|nr:C-x8-c-x5-c-x3-h type zinc finger protein [Pleurostoma richardsiae]